jgi:hypothetical protein
LGVLDERMQKSIVWHFGAREPGLLFWLLGDNPSHLDACLAHVGYFLANADGVHFLRTQGLEDTHVDTG